MIKSGSFRWTLSRQNWKFCHNSWYKETSKTFCNLELNFMVSTSISKSTWKLFCTFTRKDLELSLSIPTQLHLGMTISSDFSNSLFENNLQTFADRRYKYIWYFGYIFYLYSFSASIMYPYLSSSSWICI